MPEDEPGTVDDPRPSADAQAELVDQVAWSMALEGRGLSKKSVARVRDALRARNDEPQSG